VPHLQEDAHEAGWISTNKTVIRGRMFLRLISEKVEGMIRFACWRILQPQISVASGAVAMRSDSDWLVANEIFVDRDYDDALLQAFASRECRHSVRILDLGANVGFFSLRCIDLYLQASVQADLELVVVEGATNLVPDLNQRLARYSDEHANIKLIVRGGLVGRRGGKAMFHTSIFNSCTAGVARDNHVSRNRLRANYAEECAYFDLDELVQPEAIVDLIKCDIEGSEFDFLENYSDLLRRTRLLAIEFHPYHCDVSACRKLLDSYGFAQQRVINNHDTHSLEIYQRTPVEPKG
jgi:FkbM family methyltransferase